MRTNLKPLLLTALLPLSTYAKERPNIIYIFTDQQTASAMSCSGTADLVTPNMDKLAANGVRFVNAYCTAPLSGPSRGAMFTGHYPGTVNLLVNNSPMPKEIHDYTLGSLVKDSGYECVYGGKWHIPLLTIPDKEYGFDLLHPHCDDGLGEACAEYLSKKHDKPFFMVASFDNPHNICEYARKQNLPYGNIPLPDLKKCPGIPSNYAKNPYDADVIEMEKNKNYNVYPTLRYTADDWRRYRYTYFRLVEKIDAEIGKIVDAIEKNNLWENSIVIFSSDHGDGIGAHQWNQKSALYEEVVNIPLIVTLPKKKNAGKVMPQLISNGVDFFATICDIAGVKAPKGTSGTSFKKLLESGDPEMKHQDYIITETQFDGSNTRGWMVRTPKYKYVLYDKGSYREQMFDIINDKGEMRNLVEEEEFTAQLEELRAIMDSWLREHNIKPARRNLNDVPGKPHRQL